MTDIRKELMRKLKGKVQCRKCIHYEEAGFTYGGEDGADYSDSVSLCKKKNTEIQKGYGEKAREKSSLYFLTKKDGLFNLQGIGLRSMDTNLRKLISSQAL